MAFKLTLFSLEAKTVLLTSLPHLEQYLFPFTELPQLTQKFIPDTLINKLGSNNTNLQNLVFT